MALPPAAAADDRRPTLRDVVAPGLAALIAQLQLSPTAEDTAWRVFELLTRESLSIPASTPAGFSGICNDGTPWQFCVRLGSADPVVRYLTEVGAPQMTLEQRLALTRRRLQAVARANGWPSTAQREIDAVLAVAPGSDEGRAGAWVAVALDSAGRLQLRLYANNGWGSELERWQRLTAALWELRADRFRARLQALAALLVPTFSPVGLALTLPRVGTMLKLYLRPIAPPSAAVSKLLKREHSDGGVELLNRIEYGLNRSLSSLPPQALLLSLGMAADGAALDLKLDFCGHCLFADEPAARQATVTLGETLGLEAKGHHAALALLEPSGRAGAGVVHAFIGVGYRIREGTRLEVYVAPHTGRPHRSRTAKTNASTESALRRGVAFLLDCATPSGWRDFHLPVGTSSSWVTAYVANALLDAAPTAGFEAIAEKCSAAAKALSASFRAGQGWGYNEHVETDADSTALALILLDRLGFDAPPAAELLVPYRNEDGGFGTFKARSNRDGWATSHADVTPTVVSALATATWANTLDCLRAAGGSFGHWRSYWWLTDLYATEANLRVLRRDAGEASSSWLVSLEPSVRPFETALLVRALSHFAGKTQRNRFADCLRLLLEQQRQDGSWQASAWLRVPDRRCATPWQAPYASGRVHVDDGIFTTATVVGALSQVARRC